MLNETLSLLDLLVASNSAEDHGMVWRQISSSLREQERKLLPLSDMSIRCERAYEAVVSARVAADNGNVQLAIESLSAAVESLGGNAVKAHGAR
jgi:hypothetical protein